jgi:hypothetical protein
MTTEKLVKAPVNRVRRSPVEGRNKLKVYGKDPNFAYRIANDTDDRILTLLEEGWEIDPSEAIRVGDSKLVDDSRGIGKTRQVSVGQGIKAVLLRKRKDWFDEDQAAKQEYVNKLEQAMRPNPDGQYGKVEITRK